MLDKEDECWMRDTSVGLGRRVLDKGNECWIREMSDG